MRLVGDGDFVAAMCDRGNGRDAVANEAIAQRDDTDRDVVLYDASFRLRATEFSRVPM